MIRSWRDKEEEGLALEDARKLKQEDIGCWRGRVKEGW